MTEGRDEASGGREGAREGGRERGREGGRKRLGKPERKKERDGEEEREGWGESLNRRRPDLFRTRDPLPSQCGSCKHTKGESFIPLPPPFLARDTRPLTRKSPPHSLPKQVSFLQTKEGGWEGRRRSSSSFSLTYLRHQTPCPSHAPFAPGSAAVGSPGLQRDARAQT